MNLALFRDAVRTRIGVPNSDTFYTDPALNDLVNEAVQAVSADADWPWLQESTTFATVSGTGEYVVPVDWVETRVLCIDDYDAMEPRTLAEIREYPTSVTDVPTVYTVSGDALLLRPTPSGVYTVTHDYMKNENTLTNDADVPLMPSQFHYSVVAYACHLAYLRSGDVQRATAALTDYANWKTRMLRQRSRTAGPIRVRIRPGGGF